MAAPERFVNFDIGQPQALRDAVNSVFGASGANHAQGLVPDPGSTPGAAKFLREDGTWQTISVTGAKDVQAFIDGGGSVLTTGTLIWLHIPLTLTVTAWELLADVAGSVTVDVLRTNGAFPVTSIVGAGTKPSLTAAQVNSAAPANWTSTTLNPGDFVGFSISGPAALTKLLVCLTCNG